MFGKKKIKHPTKYQMTREKVRKNKSFVRETEENIENNAELQDFLSKISDYYTHRVIVDMDRLEICPFNNTNLETYTFDFQEHGYNNLTMEKIIIFADYIGKKYFHGVYTDSDRYKTLSSRLHQPSYSGVSLNVTGTGYSLNDASLPDNDKEIFQGVSVYNNYAKKAWKEWEEAQKKEAESKRKDLF